MEQTFFATAADFRRWLERNAANASELVVGFHKVGSGRPSMSWPDSVDEALCRLDHLIAACAAGKRL